MIKSNTKIIVEKKILKRVWQPDILASAIKNAI